MVVTSTRNSKDSDTVPSITRENLIGQVVLEPGITEFQAVGAWEGRDLRVRLVNHGQQSCRFGQLLLNGSGMFCHVAELVERLTSRAKSETEWVKALWQLLSDNCYHWFPPTDFRTDFHLTKESTSYLKLLSVYGYGACWDINLALQGVCQRLVSTRMVYLGRPPETLSHAVLECFCDGGWRVFDADLKAIYPRPDGQLASVADCQQDPHLLESCANFVSDSWRQNHSPVSMPEVGPLEVMRAIYSTSETFSMDDGLVHPWKREYQASPLRGIGDPIWDNGSLPEIELPPNGMLELSRNTDDSFVNLSSQPPSGQGRPPQVGYARSWLPVFDGAWHRPAEVLESLDPTCLTWAIDTTFPPLQIEIGIARSSGTQIHALEMSLNAEDWWTMAPMSSDDGLEWFQQSVWDGATLQSQGLECLLSYRPLFRLSCDREPGAGTTALVIVARLVAQCSPFLLRDLRPGSNTVEASVGGDCSHAELEWVIVED